MRRERNTVSYFPHDATASDGDTLTILESHFGNDGYAFWFKLLERLARTEGHYIFVKDKIKWHLFCAKAHTTPEKALTIVDMLVQLKAIDPELWNSGIIWCQKLVDNVADVYKNRRREIPQRPSVTDKCCFVCGKLLVEMRADAQFCSDNCRQTAHREKLSVTENTNNNPLTTVEKGIPTPLNPLTTDDYAQSKVKEKKVKNTGLIYPPQWGEPTRHLADLLRDIDGFKRGITSRGASWFIDGVNRLSEDLANFDPETIYFEIGKFREWWVDKHMRRPWVAVRNWLFRT